MITNNQLPQETDGMPHVVCTQLPTIKNINDIVVRMDEKLENLTPLFSKMTQVIEQFGVLMEKDTRRERDIDILTKEIGEVRKDLNAVMIKMEGMTVKIAGILAVAVILGGIAGGIVADQLKSNNSYISTTNLK
jgi:hypothetical protein